MIKTKHALLMTLFSGCVFCMLATSSLFAQSGKHVDTGGLDEGAYYDANGATGEIGGNSPQQGKKRKSRAGGALGGMGGGNQLRPIVSGAAGGPGMGEGDDYEDQEGDFGGAAGPEGYEMGAPGMGHARRGTQKVKLVLQMYPVGDLLKQSSEGPFDGFVLPGLSLPGLSGVNRLPGSGGGGGGASGGGVFAVPVSPRVQLGGMGGGGMGMDYDDEGDMGMGFGGGPRFYSGVSVKSLADTILDSVSRESWTQTGGPGTMSVLGEVLIVNQTEEVHQQLGVFLEMLEKTFKRKPTITIKAIWLTVDEEMFQSLDIERDQQVNSKVLAQLVKTNGSRSQVTCFDGQTVHIAAGNLKSTIESVVPVVGQIDSNSQTQRTFVQALSPKRKSMVPSHVLAQAIGGIPGGQASGTKARSVGYQPISRWINYGAVLQLRPKVDADLKMVTLAVSNSLVNSGSQSKPGAKLGYDGGVGIDLDNHDLRCQQFQSNVRLKDSTPTLVGGAAFRSDKSEEQTYLILEAIVNND